MIYSVQATPINAHDNRPISISLSVPTQCPHCMVAYSQPPIGAYYAKEGISTPLSEMGIYAVFFCPHCNSFFSTSYQSRGTLFDLHGEIKTTLPEIISTQLFSENINTSFPEFVLTFHDAENAEKKGLKKICDVAYMKSLEILLKEYAKHQNPDKINQINNCSIIECVENYIDNPRAKVCLDTPWIRNRFLFYSCAFDGYELQVLKNYILGLVATIDSEILFSETSTF